MKNLWWLTAFCAAMLLTALTLGSSGLLLAASAGLAASLYGFVSLLWTAATLRFSLAARDAENLHRGDEAELTLTLSHGCPLPLGQLEVDLSLPEEEGAHCLYFTSLFRRRHQAAFRMHLSHVGPSRISCGATVRFRDLFHIAELVRGFDQEDQSLLVLPRTFDMEDISLAMGDSGAFATRATEDITNPADIRNYMPGDALKKVHWKLTARRREIMIRRFEEPVLPDTLILLDTSPPDAAEDELTLNMQDTLLETAASAMKHEIGSGHEPRMPLHGEEPVECDKSMPPLQISQALARVRFLPGLSYGRLLMMETRRTRQTGAVISITAGLNGDVTELLIRMRRMGPAVRLYLVTPQPDAPWLQAAVDRLQSGSVEVRYVAVRTA